MLDFQTQCDQIEQTYQQALDFQQNYPPASLWLARQIAEYICKQLVLQEIKPKPEGFLMLGKSVRKLQEHACLPELFSLHLEVIQKFGNIAVHDLEGSPFITQDFIQSSLNSLYVLVNWYCTQYQPRQLTEDARAVLFTEQAGGWKHLKKAQERLGIELDIVYNDDEQASGRQELFARLDMAQRIQQASLGQQAQIFLFERSEPDGLAHVTDPHNSYKTWTDACFSLALPLPAHRRKHDACSLEYFYPDEALTTADTTGRRLFLRSEFDEQGCLRENPKIRVGANYWNTQVKRDQTFYILTSNVFQGKKTLALTRAEFAEYVYQETFQFGASTFEAFRQIFTLLTDILHILPEPDTTTLDRQLPSPTIIPKPHEAVRPRRPSISEQGKLQRLQAEYQQLQRPYHMVAENLEALEEEYYNATQPRLRLQIERQMEREKTEYKRITQRMEDIEREIEALQA